MIKAWFVALVAIATAAMVVAPSRPLAAQNSPDGAVIFKQRCSSCHAVVAGKPATLGPNLAGVVGRKAGTGSYNYSAAMKKSNIVWSKANLDKFLAGPPKMVPGTKMTVSLADGKQRAAIVLYLSK